MMSFIVLDVIIFILIETDSNDIYIFRYKIYLFSEFASLPIFSQSSPLSPDVKSEIERALF